MFKQLIDTLNLMDEISHSFNAAAIAEEDLFYIYVCHNHYMCMYIRAVR